ncbi:hypothetical protein EMIT019CA3_11214 [Bacillus pseudomycoides]
MRGILENKYKTKGLILKFNVYIQILFIKESRHIHQLKKIYYPLLLKTLFLLD